MTDDKFRTEVPTFVFAEQSEFDAGVLSRVGPLKRSVQHEFEKNERGKWLPELRYVTEERAVQRYPASKGNAPREDLVGSYTRDLGQAGSTLQDFYHRQPAVGNGAGQIREKLSLAEIVILRCYTGPWFQAINYNLRHLPEARCCDATPYFEDLPIQGDAGKEKSHNPRRVFLRDPSSVEAVCIHCGRSEDEHSVQRLESWATSAALLVSGIVKLRVATLPMTVYRGVKEEFVQLPRDFVEADRSRFACGVEPAPMSTTEDRAVALSYAGRNRGSLLEIEFDAANLGAELTFLSQYPAEAELVFPPGTMLTCMGNAGTLPSDPTKRDCSRSGPPSTQTPTARRKSSTSVPPVSHTSFHTLNTPTQSHTLRARPCQPVPAMADHLQRKRPPCH